MLFSPIIKCTQVKGKVQAIWKYCSVYADAVYGIIQMVLTLIRATKGNSYFALWSLQWTITIARYVLVYLLRLMNLDRNRSGLSATSSGYPCCLI